MGKYGKANCLMRSVKQFAFPSQRHDNFCIFPDIIAQLIFLQAPICPNEPDRVVGRQSPPAISPESPPWIFYGNIFVECAPHSRFFIAWSYRETLPSGYPKTNSWTAAQFRR
jgi:hypothetical protein